MLLLCYLLILTWTVTTGRAYLRLSAIMDQPDDQICFVVLEKSLQSTQSGEEEPRVALVLQVNYPQAVAEAGEVVLESRQLTAGFHAIKYKHKSTNMTHDLQVTLDGQKVKFLKSEVPRWFSVSTFREVLVFMQGNIATMKCYGELNNKLSGESVSRSTYSSENLESESFFIREIEKRTNLRTTASTKNKIEPLKQESGASSDSSKEAKDFNKYFELTPAYFYENNIQSRVNVTLNDDFLNRTGHNGSNFGNNLPNGQILIENNSSVDHNGNVLPQKTQILPQSMNNLNQNVSNNKPEYNTSNVNDQNLKNTAKTSKNSTKNNQNSDTENPPKTNSSSNSNQNSTRNDRSESSQLCLESNCGQSSIEHNYTLAFSLAGALGLIALIAITISVVFYRKKKKIIAAARAKPRNRLRQQIYDNIATEVDSQLRLKEMENVYEEIP